MSLERIRDRVAKGGHHVPDEDVRRRFGRSIKHFFNHYRPLVDEYSVFINRDPSPKVIAFGSPERETVIDAELYQELQSHHDQAD